MLMPTPRIYEHPEEELFEDLHSSLQGPEIELLYVTDREPETDQNGNLRYGYGRSGSLAFGTVTVALGEPTSTWENLLTANRAGQRPNPVHLSLGSVTEIARLPPDPLPYSKESGQIVYDPTALAKRKEVVEQFRQSVARRLEFTPRKELFVYVHGFRNTFEDAVFAMSEFWHFLGREGMPIASNLLALYQMPKHYLAKIELENNPIYIKLETDPNQWTSLDLVFTSKGSIIVANGKILFFPNLRAISRENGWTFTFGKRHQGRYWAGEIEGLSIILGNTTSDIHEF